ncbi:O-antigen polymerase [Vibrio breoganii]|uniref:Oligosaccharide repeat unit polymerase n=1 Tax=Vibrio breoganii TaxID=553239 RepID=A0ABX1UCE9_9VIBR|nr:O-antigen polymerase [Vibrio breoganii]NMO74822.1 oligosaccharide repeat unit polymerase [Vibrio breoganii]NMR71455.1 oligosaccharide repeat unit polymerase [Vibrio breoganii]PML84901.1 hypothetical protein BCT67_15610 [Vibrio breoganii]
MPLLNPGLIFFLTWLTPLLALPLVGFDYNPISSKGYVFYFLGILFFVGSYTYFYKSVEIFSNKRVDLELKFNFNQIKIIKILSISLVLLLPIYILYVVRQVPANNLATYFIVVRNMSLSNSLSLPFYISNLPIIAMIVGYIATVMKVEKEIESYIWTLIIISVVIYLSVTGSRSGTVNFILTVLIIFISLRPEKLLRYLIVGFFAAITIMIFSGFIFGRGGVDSNSNFFDLSVIIRSIEGFMDYFFNGVILFDNYILNASLISEPDNNIFIFFKSTLRSFGIIDDFTGYQPITFYNFASNKVGNVFTMYYFFYPMMGAGLSICFMVVYGFIYGVLTAFYRCSLILLLLYSNFTSNLFTSIIREPVFTNLNFTIKMVILCYLFSLVGKQINLKLK